MPGMVYFVSWWIRVFQPSFDFQISLSVAVASYEPYALSHASDFLQAEKRTVLWMGGSSTETQTF